MMQRKWLVYISVFTYMGLNSSLINAKEYLVDNPQAYMDIAGSLEAGDVVTLADGTWTDFQIAFSGQGTEDSPITLKAETAGKVILTGESNLRLAGEYLLVSGLFFKDGYSPSNAVIEFRQSKTQLANHSRVTQTVVESFNNKEKFSAGNWVALYGRYNRFDHNALVGKSTSGVTMAVKLNTLESQENHHRIDHNYFGQRPILGSNGGETLRIGTSHYSLSNSFTMIENNYFDRCNGEVEIISNKSGSNTIQNNVFFESRGTLTLRHGNGNIVQNNVFFGNGEDHTGGIRVINGDQTIRNNYLEGVTGYRFGSGLTVMNGVPNSKINRYHQVDNANITQNSLINLDHIHFAAGSDAERSAAPINSRFTNNLIVHQENKDGISLFDDVSGIEFDGNIVHNVSDLTIDKGFAVENVELVRAKNGLLYPSNPEFSKTGVDKSLQPIAKQDTGPSWYNKPELSVEFASGKTHQVSPDNNVLYKALQQAHSGDVIELAKGHYVASRTLPIDKVVSFVGKAGVSISFERKSLFVIEDGGSLALKNVVITGADAPDSAGNTLIRNTRLPTINNYRLVMDNVIVKDLDINHSFHVIDSGYRALADEITITNSQFSNITGDVLRLNKEQDDLGIYNAEYVTLDRNVFQDIQGTLMNVYRGGTDESTFGPHVTVTANTIKNVGFGKRNKSKALMTLHGVQVTNILNNTFTNVPAIAIEHTVGEPQTRIQYNQFMGSVEPVVQELFTQGPLTAVVSDNTFSAQ